MPRRNKRKGHPQHGRGSKKPRGYHRSSNSGGIGVQIKHLEHIHKIDQAEQRKAA